MSVYCYQHIYLLFLPVFLDNVNVLFYISFIVQEIRKKEFDYVFVPSNTPTFIQDLVRYFISKTIITDNTRDCWSCISNSEASSIEIIGDSRHFVKESGSRFQLQKAASMSIAIFKELKWRLAVIFFDSLYGKKVCTVPNKCYRTIGK